ncbi:hypothetical protein L0938_14565 [Paracidovorax citrulli]
MIAKMAGYTPTAEAHTNEDRMTEALERLRERTQAALSLVRATRPVLAELDIKVDERTATALPLALAAMDTAEAIYALLLTQPEQYWVAALVMQRSQMEYVLRSAFFAKAASHRELMTFRRTGRMPTRGNRAIHLADVAEEACQHLGWEKSKLLSTVRAHQRDLSGLVHGGKEVLAIYTQHDAWGDLTVEWSDLVHHVDNIAVFVQLSLGVAMLLSPLDAAELDKAVRPIYEAATTYFADDYTS